MGPTLLTQRLNLIPFGRQDDRILWEMFIHPFIRKYLWDDLRITLEQAQEISFQNYMYFRQNRWGLWRVQPKKFEIDYGFVGLWPFFDEEQPQLIYGLYPGHCGQGYAKEGAQRVCQYAFEDRGFTYLIASCDEPNFPSQKVALSLGMKQIETREIEGKKTLFYRIDA